MAFVISILLKALEIYSFILLVYAFLSWVPGAAESPLGQFIAQLVEPLLKPFRKWNLEFLGLDWTVFVAMILLNLVARMLIRFLWLL